MCIRDSTSTALKGIAISGGALVLDDSFNASALGNITQSGSGTVSLGGTLILDQASTNLSSAGLTALDLGSGAIITGGGNTLTADAVFALTASAGTLNNVTLGTNLSLTGTTTITIVVNDGVTSAQTSFVLTVNAVDDPPTFAAGVPSAISTVIDTATTFQVTVNGDTKYEPTEAFAVTLSGPTGGAVIGALRVRGPSL